MLLRIMSTVGYLALISLVYCTAPAEAGTSVNVSINGYLPAPPGVVVHVAAGRPYYVEHERRVYLERERPRHGKHRHREERREREAHAHQRGQEKHGGHRM